MKTPQEHKKDTDEALKRLEIELDPETYKRVLSFTYKAQIDSDEPFWWVFIMLGYFSSLVAPVPGQLKESVASLSASATKIGKIQKANSILAQSGRESWYLVLMAGGWVSLVSAFAGGLAVYNLLPRQNPTQEQVTESARELILFNCRREFEAGEPCLLENPDQPDTDN